MPESRHTFHIRGGKRAERLGKVRRLAASRWRDSAMRIRAPATQWQARLEEGENRNQCGMARGPGASGTLCGGEPPTAPEPAPPPPPMALDGGLRISSVISMQVSSST
jgi:hypothetical protein